MRVNGFSDCGQHQNYSRVQYYDNEETVTKKEPNTETTAENLSDTQIETENQRDNVLLKNSSRSSLSAGKVIDAAVKKDFAVDKSLIGTESRLENLDIRKVISDMQRDRVLMEYQTFVRNPETDDGIVRKLNNS